MKKIANIFFLAITCILFQNCEDEQFESSLNYVTFGDTVYSTAVDVDGSTTLDVTVYTSRTVSADTSFDIIVDESSNAAAGSYSVPTSVTIPSGTNTGVLTLSLSDLDLGIGVNKLVLNFDPENLNYALGESTEVQYIQNCTETIATLDIVFDGYGDESGWVITDSLDEEVISGGPYTQGQASASETISLCSGRDYTFTFTDSYGDGLSYPANGTYTLTIDGETKASGGGDFGASESTEFDTK
ncbi:hypothetical protein [Algibacter sp. L3A6]|uniref:hypothetical protein n=1 Tax=Algibacter sp. L3A6 TaxID=2686366 RepID=UPI00131DEBFB|nr:hypothetical protein [Algibacter sp. L3A6]